MKSNLCSTTACNESNVKYLHTSETREERSKLYTPALESINRAGDTFDSILRTKVMLKML